MELVHSKDFTKKTVDGKYQIIMKLGRDRITAHGNTDLIFELADARRAPFRDLEPMMGADGHCVIISANIRNNSFTCTKSRKLLPTGTED